MPYVQSGNDDPIDPATAEDLRALFDAGGRIAVEVGHHGSQVLQAAVIGDAPFILWIDQETGHTRKPAGKLDRDQTFSILERYLESEELHPDYQWIDVDLPTVPARGCRSAATALLLIAWLGLCGGFVALAAASAGEIFSISSPRTDRPQCDACLGDGPGGLDAAEFRPVDVQRSGRPDPRRLRTRLAATMTGSSTALRTSKPAMLGR